MLQRASTHSRRGAAVSFSRTGLDGNNIRLARSSAVCQADDRQNRGNFVDAVTVGAPGPPLRTRLRTPPRHHEAAVYWAMTTLMTRRLDRPAEVQEQALSRAGTTIGVRGCLFAGDEVGDPLGLADLDVVPSAV